MPKKKVLIVDDERSITQIVKAILEDTGRYDVREEHRGRDALNAVLAFRPDVILLDVMMPGMDGTEVAAQLKADARVSAIPVIFLTAALRKQEEYAAGGFIGGHPFIAKPFKAEELMERLDAQLGASD